MPSCCQSQQERQRQTRCDCSLWPREGNASQMATAKARASAWGRRQNTAPAVPAPEISAVTEPWPGTVAAHTFLGACETCLCPGTHDSGPTPLGEHTTRLQLQQLPAGLGCRRHSPNTPLVAFIPLFLPSLTEQVSPNKLLLSPTLVWEGNGHWRVSYKQRQAPNQSGEPTAVWARERKGVCSWSHKRTGLNPRN